MVGKVGNGAGVRFDEGKVVRLADEIESAKRFVDDFGTGGDLSDRLAG